MLETTHPHLPSQVRPAHVVSGQVQCTPTGARHGSSRGICPALFAFALMIGTLFTGLSAHGQALPTASRKADLQVGAAWSYTKSDYAPEYFRGPVLWFDLDFRSHWGVEGNFKQANDSDTRQGMYERSYEIGPRYVMHYGRLAPFVKALYGRGVIQGPKPLNPFNLAYNMYAFGGGADYMVWRRVSIRAEYEHQIWPGFVHGLTPNIIDVGAAYHF